MAERRGAQLVAGIVAVATALLIGVGWLGYQYEVEVMLFPTLVGGVTVLLAVAAALRRPPADAAAAERGGSAGLGRQAGQLAWLGLAFPAMLAVGMVAGAGLFLALALWRGGLRPLPACALAIAIALAIRFVFGQLLGVSLPDGWWA